VDGVVVSDSGIPSLEFPALTYALRGIAALEIFLTGPDRDLHSGIYGGSVENPAMALCSMLASLRDPATGKITIPGFYDDLVELTEFEREGLAKQPFDAEAYRDFLGVPQLFGESGYSPIEQKSARPTLEINGLTSGYQGIGSKTIVPSKASAKITMRLAPNQDPKKITALVSDHLRKICPPTVSMELKTGHCGAPYLVSPTSAAAEATLRAMKQSSGKDPILLREGGSIPIVTEFQKILGVDTWLLGMALPDDNAHSPNEKFSLDSFDYGLKLGVALWPELAAAFAKES
jgi:acetylornithine deacetylase/succinyl-diaminopimelate desuccinylase-like protein